MSRSNLSGALGVAKGVEDIPTRADMFTQLLRAAHKKADAALGRQMLAEARASFAGAECGGKMSAAIYALAAAAAPMSLGDTVEFINVGTACLNSSGASGAEKHAAPDARRPGDSPGVQQAFASLGKIDLENALLSASKIEDRPTALMARLFACEGSLAAAVGGVKAVTAKSKRLN
jgi:hypothetical protein